MEGKIRNGKTQLASSTLITLEKFGIIISYIVRVRLYMGGVGGEVISDLPFKLVAPFPENEKEVQEQQAKIQMPVKRDMVIDRIFEDFARRRQYSEDHE